MGTSSEHNGWNIEGMAVLVLRALLEDAGWRVGMFRQLVDERLDEYVRREVYLPVHVKDPESAEMVTLMVKKFIWELDDSFGFVTGKGGNSSRQPQRRSICYITNDDGTLPP